MAAVSPTRRVALALLSEQRRRDGRARELLRASQDMGSLGPKGRALATRLVLGVNVARGELDRRIDSFVSKPGSLEPRVRDALRLSAFELLYLGTPRQVAVSQGVELVRGVRSRAARMANAVLRRIADAREEVDAARHIVEKAAAGGPEATIAQLCMVSGYPEWLVRRLVDALGARDAAAVCAGALEPAPVFVAANGVRHDAEATAHLLERAGLHAEPCAIPGSFQLGSAAGLSSSRLLSRVDVVACDLGAQLVCRIAAPRPGERMLEIGQGRATKSVLLASATHELGGAARIIGVDNVESKVRLAGERIDRAGLASEVSCRCLDATLLADDDALPEDLSGEFDVVLLDAPCSGTGTMRRHPETPWSFDEAMLDPVNLSSIPALQLRLLEATAARVARGGSLVYSTCSLLPEEDAQVVHAFLASDAGRGFTVASPLDAPGVGRLPAAARELVSSQLTDEGFFASVPGRVPFDGHFCTRLVREP